MLRPTRLLTAGLSVVLAAAVVQPVTGALGASRASAAPTAVQHDHRGHEHRGHEHGGAARCTPSADGAVVCSHADAPPPGVDVTRMPSTQELLGRRGAAGAAVMAAGGDEPAQHAAGGGVPCDGDGVSGPRVQAMYVVAADRPNRFAALQANLQAWAAGVDEVVSRSAARTGGVRHVRFVTGPAVSGTCTPTVLDVTVPAGANASFGTTMDAVKALGHTDPSRKYLMWVDTAGLCGVATTYLDDRAGQDNANNGRYPQYARIDAPCWGQPNSVEAHEVLHSLGGVQASAPNATAAGHCTDESDRMCYVDGAGVTMRQVCPTADEALLDCRNDDYFLAGTPPVGSYLANHWNTADSRFLMTTGGTGGDTGGDGGGDTGTAPAGLSVVLTVAGPATAGLPTAVTATVQDAPGRQPTVAWTVSRRDCTFADRTARQTTVTCSVASKAKATVTVVASNGVTAPVTASGALTFSTAPRSTTVTSTVGGTTGPGPVRACPRTKVPVAVTVVDTASGAPVKGLRVKLLQTVSGRTQVLRTVTTGADGRASTSVKGVHGATISARTVQAGAFPSRSSVATALTATPCATSMVVAMDAGTAGAGAPVVATGRLQRTLGDDTSGVARARVRLVLTPAGGGAATVLATGRTDATGAFRLTGTPRTSGTVAVHHAATASYGASVSTPVQVTVGA